MESLPLGKPLELLWLEASSWFYVEYALSDGVKRRGYIMSSNVNILSGSVDPRNMTRSNRYVIHAASVFWRSPGITYLWGLLNWELWFSI